MDGRKESSSRGSFENFCLDDVGAVPTVTEEKAEIVEITEEEKHPNWHEMLREQISVQRANRKRVPSPNLSIFKTRKKLPKDSALGSAREPELAAESAPPPATCCRCS